MDNSNQTNIFLKYRNILVENYLKFSQESQKMNQLLLSILRIHVSLRNLSYIFENQFSSYTYIISIIARPTIFINIENVQYIVLILCFFYLIFSQIKCFFQRWISIFGQLLYLGYINIFFEISQGFLDYFVEVLLIFINIFDFLILQGTLNFDSQTIFVPKKSILELIQICLNILLMYSAKLQFNLIAIQIIAIINTFINLLYNATRFPIKSYKQTVIIVSIEIITIYLGMVELIVGQHNSITDLLVALFLIRLIQNQLSILIKKQPNNLEELISLLYDSKYAKKINIKQPTSKEDIILYASLFAYKEKYYESLIILHSIKKLNWLAMIKKEILTKIWLNQLDIQLKSKTQAEQGLTQAVEQLTMLEDQNLTLQSSIISLIKNKCVFMRQISLKEKIDFKSLISFVGQLQTVQNQLEKQFEIFPNLKTQNVLCFLYSEILNDFLKADSLQSLLTKKDEKQNFSIFSNKMVYLILSHQNQEIVIKRASNNAAYFFKINQQHLLQQNINMIIPPGITKQHMKLVKQFLNTGESKFMRKLSDNYYQNLSKNILQQCDFAIDVSFKSEEINFITFIQPIVDQSMVLILDQDTKITTTSETFLQVFNLVSTSYFTNQYFTKFIPSFKNVKITKEQLESKAKGFIQISILQENVEFILNQEKEEGTSCTSTNYVTTYELFPKILNKEILFYIVKFEYFKRLDNSAKITYSETNYSVVKGSYSVSENVFIDDPNDMNVTNQFFSHEIQENVVSKQFNDILVYNPNEHLTQLKDNIQSSRPLFYQTVNIVAQSISQPSVEEPRKQQIQSLENIQEESSKISTLRSLRSSPNFKKYEILFKLEDLDGYTKSHKIFLSFLSVSLLIQLAFILSQFLSTQQSLTNLIADIDLLQIKNFAFQPFESFLVTRWTIFNYNNLLAAGTINQTYYQQLVSFPRSNLHLGFDRLQDNVDQVLNKLSLQQFLEDTYLDIQLYTKSNEGEHFNVSLRNCITIMLNYQYLTKMAYQIDGNVVVDSPHIYYQYRNYYILKQEFGRINEDLLDNTIYRSEMILNQLQTIYILSLIFLVLFLLGSYLLYIQIEKSHLRFFNLVFCCQSDQFQKDITRLSSLQNIIHSDYNNLFQYNFNLLKKEKFLAELKVKLDKTEHKKFILDENEHLSVSDLTIRIFLFIVLILILAQASISYGQVKNYLNKYPATARFYKGVSDIGTDVPCVYAQSNILYGRAFFPYYDEADIEAVFSEITKAVQEIREFTEQTADFSEFFLSQNFANYYNYLMDNNLCDQFLDDMKEKSATICPIIMNQGMQRGLLAILVNIINYIQTEQANNQFTLRLKPNFLELEGAFLVSEIVRKLNIEIQSDLYLQTDKLISYIAMHSSIIIVIMIMFALFVLIVLKSHLQKIQFLAQRLLYLVPLQTLLFDDGFERNAKTILMQESF